MGVGTVNGSDGLEGRVFLSHASVDADVIKKHIEPAIRETIPDVFYSPEGIKGGMDWQNELLRQLYECSYFVIVVSRATLSRECYVRHELAAWVAEHRDLAGVVPVRLDDTPLIGLELKLPSTQDVDFRQPGERALTDLANALEIVTVATPVVEKVERSGHFNPEVRASYLDWVTNTHESIGTTLAGEELVAPLERAPMPDRLVEVDSTAFAQEEELSHLENLAEQVRDEDGAVSEDRAEAKVLKDQPLPLHLGATLASTSSI